MADVYIYYKGNGSLTVPYSPRGAEYKFLGGHKNVVDGDVWGDLIGPNGPLFAFKKQFKATSRPGAGDRSHRVTPAALPPKVVAATPAQADAEKVDLIAKQQAEIARLREQLALAAAEKDEAPEAEAPLVIDPGSLSVSKLAKAIEGLGVDELMQVRDLEKSGKNRSSAVDMLSDAIAKASEDMDEPDDTEADEG